ncbi:hypothetical protein [Desulfamplus magnetovallimortis]|nr:hypothetical protein [Desulfamplus magnetovallimortis]
MLTFLLLLILAVFIYFIVRQLTRQRLIIQELRKELAKCNAENPKRTIV